MAGLPPQSCPVGTTVPTATNEPAATIELDSSTAHAEIRDPMPARGAHEQRR